MVRSLKHIFHSNEDLNSRIYHFFSMQRSIQNRYKTHFSEYQREWESNLWDTWFRLKTLDKIQNAVIADKKIESGHINFPGIGFERRAEYR